MASTADRDQLNGAMADLAQPRWLERTRSSLRAGLYLLIVVSPLPFGAVQPASVVTVELWALALACLALPLLVTERRLPPPGAIAMIVMVVVIVSVGLIQLAPRSADGSALVPAPLQAARAMVWQVLPEARPEHALGTLDGPATVDALLRFVAYVFVGLATFAALRRREHLVTATAVVAVAGALQALYGIAEYVTGHQHIFGYAKVYFNDEASGTFINRNHFAGYLAACLPAALALAIAEWRRSTTTTSWRSRLLRLTEPRGMRLILGGMAAGTIWLGVIFSYSRGGLGAALIGAAGLAWFVAADRRRVAWLAMLIVLPTAALLWHDVRAPGERFAADGAELASLHGRVPAWDGARRMAVDFLPLGSGLGTFEVGFPLYRSAGVTAHWDHAHNDWLQTFVEGGPIAGFAAIGILATLLATAAGLRRVGEPTRTLGAGVCCGALATAVHAFVDFPLRIPAISLLLAFLVGATLAAAAIDRDAPPEPQP